MCTAPYCYAVSILSTYSHLGTAIKKLPLLHFPSQSCLLEHRLGLGKFGVGYSQTVISPDLFWKPCTYSHLGRNRTQFLLILLGPASMLGWLISPQTSVYRCVWIWPLMANAAAHPEGKLSPLPALFPFYFSSSSFLTFGGFLSMFHT